MLRAVELLEVPTGPAIAGILPRLAAALSGDGPALAPVAGGDAAQARQLVRALAVGTALADGEDDADDPTSLVLATSGSTGPPKGALLSRSALAASAAATQQRLGPPGTWLLALPAQHIAGLQVLLRSLATGSAPHVLDTGPPFTAERFAAAAGRMPSGPRYVSLVPTQLHRLLGSPTGIAALREFTGVLVGGSATPAALLDRGRAAGAVLVTTYGMTETCGGCVYDGLPLDGVEVELDEEGRVSLSGPVVARGYRNLPGHPAFRVHGGLRSFRTEDVAQWSVGRLRILGRADDVLITGGLKIAPARLEEAIAGLPGVADVVVTGVPDAEWGQRVVAVLVPPDGASAPSLHELRQSCTAAGIPSALQPRQLVLLDRMPSRGPGKPDRKAVQAIATERTAG